MTRRATPQTGVDRMVSTSWSGRRWSSPAVRQGRALARGLEGTASRSNIIMSAIETARFRVVGLLFLLPSNTVSTAIDFDGDQHTAQEWQMRCFFV